MTLDEQDIATIDRLIDKAIHKNVRPMVDGLDDALSRQVANGFADMDRRFQAADHQFAELKAELLLIEDKLDDQHLRLDNHESRIAELEEHNH